DVALTGYRTYRLPEGDAYAPFKSGGEPIALWELLTDDDAGATPLDDPPGFLTDKAVLLFLERDDENLSDCSPNQCDDKGSEVTLALRRLLVGRADAQRIVEAMEDGADEAFRLGLPDLRLRGYDVPNTRPVASRDVLEAFQAAVSRGALVTALGD